MRTTVYQPSAVATRSLGAQLCVHDGKPDIGEDHVVVLLGIERLLVESGGNAHGSLMAAGVVDELSIL